MILICKNCNKEFQPTHTVELRYIKNPNKNYFCSKSCAAFYNSKYKDYNLENRTRDNQGRFIKQDLDKEEVIYKCKNCNKEFSLTGYQKKRLRTEENPNLFCSKSCSVQYSNKHRDSSWQETRKQTNQKLYGDENYVNREKISQTIKQLYRENSNYGFSSDNYKQIMLEKYGVDNISNSEWIKEHNEKKYGTSYYFQSEEYKNNMENHYTNRNDYYGRVSKVNKKFIKLLEDNNIKYTIEQYVRPYYYDICINNTYMIEIDPISTHNSYKTIFNNSGKDKYYHRDKTDNSIGKGYKCIHIFDWDDKNKILYLMQNKKILYARKLYLKEVSQEECTEFLNKYHLQNTCKGQVVRLGLYLDDETLIEVMTFGKPRYNKKYEWELLRLCTRTEYKVTGGSEKLFNTFIYSYKPKSIISYCDYSKFSGEVYQRLGFKLDTKGTPSKHWYNTKTKRHITDNLLRQRGFSQLHNDNDYKLYKKGDNNEELMLQNGYLPIYDCGQLTFVWKGE